MGSRQSERYARFYDEDQDDERDGDLRVEIEYKGDRAELAWARLLVKPVEEWSADCMGMLLDFVDFRDYESNPNPSRRTRREWWEAIIDGAERVKLPIPRKVTTIEGAADWVDHQVAPVLAMLAALVPDPVAYFETLCQRGRMRWKTKHRTLMAEAS